MTTMEVPKELAELRQWMLWSSEYGTKVPYQTNGLRGKSNDPRTWATLDECLEHVAERSGVAFVFSDDDPFTGIDLDDCITDGVFEPWAQEILNKFTGIAYAEMSPSGTGVKLTVRAKKPEGSGCNNRKGVECYDTKRFWTWTGQSLGEGFDTIGDGQAAVEWLVEKFLHTATRKTGEKRLLSSGGGSFELLARAESYIDACKAGTKGNLRNSAFQNAGHLHALVGTNGERLSDTDVYNLLKRWNLRGTDQLRDDELREAAINGRKNGQPPADKPAEVTKGVTTDDSDVDLSGILEEIIEDTLPDVPFSPGDFPRETIPTDGIIGQVIKYNLATSMYPQPELALAGALALVSTITGRKVQTEFGTRTNVYVLGLGESGSGKESARKVNKDLLYLAGGEIHIGPERLASSAGLTAFVKDRLAVLFQIDEIGNMLATMKNPGKAAHLYNIGTVLMQMYSSSDCMWIGDAYADMKQTPQVDQPHPVVYGTCTPDGFWLNLTTDNVSNGLLGRMLVFEAPGYVDKRRPAKIDPPEALLERIRQWVEFRSGGIDRSKSYPVTIRHTEEALERYESHLEAICKQRRKESREAAALWSRSGEKTAKLALLFACSREPYSEHLRVELDDVERAIKIANWLTRRMLRQVHDYVSANFVEDNKKKVLRTIGKGIPLNELTRKTQWLRGKERSEILMELIDQQLIEIKETPTRGRMRRYVERIN